VVLDQLRRLGDDLSTERPVDFYLYFPNERDAERVRDELLRAGFSVECQASASDSKWLCLATKMMRPDLVDLDSTRTTLEQIAANFGGEFDGWETQVIQVNSKDPTDTSSG
jgi:hypothetical protein